MIRINLLPTKRRKKPKPLAIPIIVSAFGLLLASVSLFTWNMMLGSKIKLLESKKADQKSKSEDLDKKIAGVQDFESVKQTFIDRIGIIEKLRKSQNTPVKILNELSLRLTEGIWFTSMNISGSKIDIDGFGFSNQEIVSFVQSLKGSGLIKEVSLKGTQKSAIDGIEVFSFKIVLEIAVQ